MIYCSTREGDWLFFIVGHFGFPHILISSLQLDDDFDHENMISQEGNRVK